MKFAKLGLILSALALFVAACTQATNTTTSNTAVVNSANSTANRAAPQTTATMDELAAGRELYTKQCSRCHKDDGTGGPTEIEGKKIEPDDLTSEKIKGFTDEKTIGYVKNGVPDEGMPAFKDKLTESEIREVVKYVRIALQKKTPDQTASPAG